MKEDERSQWMDQEIRDERVQREQERKRNRQRRKKQIRRRRVCFVVILGLVIGAFIALNGKDRPSSEAPQAAEINGIPVVQSLVDSGTLGRPGTERKIKYIVIHETGNEGANAGAASHASYLAAETEKTAKSWHYTVDDHEIYHHIPDNEVAFHAGDQLKKDGGNLNGIGIELCVNPENDYNQTMINSAALTAHLMRDYKLSLDDVKKHQDFSGKNCPEKMITDSRWEEFLELVEKAYKEKK